MCVWSFKSWKWMYLFSFIDLGVVLQRIILSISQFKIIFTKKKYYMYIRSEMVIWRSLPLKVKEWVHEILKSYQLKHILEFNFVNSIYIEGFYKTGNRLKCWLFYKQPHQRSKKQLSILSHSVDFIEKTIKWPNTTYKFLLLL